MSECRKPVPAQLMDVWDDFVAAIQARDAAVKSFFKFQVRNAIYLGNIAQKKRREFLDGIRALYPEFDEHEKIYFDEQKREVYIQDKT